MDLFGRKGRDPLLFDCDDKNDFDSLLGDRDYSKLDTSGLDLDLDAALDPNSDLGNWLHNSSLSQLTSALDTDNEASLSEGNLLPVNPESIMPPMQMPQQPQPCDIDADMDIANSAAMRLHANCRDVESLQKAVLVTQQQQQQQTTPQTQHIQLVAMPVATAAVSNGSAHSTPVHSPLKANTIILDTGNGTAFSVAGTTYIASPQKLQTVSSSQKTRVLTPSQCSPVLVGHLQSGVNLVHNRPITVTVASPLKNTNYTVTHQQQTETRTVHSTVSHEEKVYPKPVFSYSCLIALALKNSKTGNLPVSEIYNFMCENFPYFKTAPDGWKNSVRHNLSLNKCFAKVENPKLSSGAKKGCLWALNPAKKKKMEEEISKWGKKDPVALLSSMAYPENLEAIEKGQAGLPLRKDGDDENCPSPSPATPVKKEIAVTPKFVQSLVTADYKEETFDVLEQEYASHAHLWAHEPDEEVHIDVFTNSPLASSPLLSRGSPLPHTPSRSAQRTGSSTMYQGTFYASSPLRLSAGASPASVRANLFGVATPPRTLSALN